MSENSIQVWNSLLSKSLMIPGTKVNRTEFLKQELKIYVQDQTLLDKIETLRPWEVVSDEVLEKIAKSCINNITIKSSTLSFASGLPGGLAMIGTIPADILQSHCNTLVLCQKLSYLYGLPDLFDEEGNLTEGGSELLTVYMGVAMGLKAANVALHKIAIQLAKTLPNQLAKMALTKTKWFPVIAKIAVALGAKSPAGKSMLTKAAFAKGVSKAIPVLGGVVSGGLTAVTMKASGKRLLENMKTQKELMQEKITEINNEDDYIEAEIIED
jgi:hypothetical protein